MERKRKNLPSRSKWFKKKSSKKDTKKEKVEEEQKVFPPEPEGPKYVLKKHSSVAKDGDDEESEEEEYDFVDDRPKGRKASLLEALCYFTRAYLGPGTTSIHVGYMYVGLLIGSMLNLYLGLFVTYCSHILTESAQKIYKRIRVPSLSYPDLMEAAMDISPFPVFARNSKMLRYLVDIVLVAAMFGSCCSCQIAIAKCLNQILHEYSVIVSKFDDRIFIGVFLLPCIMICMILTNKYLAPFTIVLDFAFSVIVLYVFFHGIGQHPRPIREFPFYTGVAGYFKFIGICLFSCEGGGVALTVENGMHNPYQINTVLGIGMSSVVVMTMISGFCGYFEYGEESLEPVVLNFSSKIWFGVFWKSAYVVLIFVTFAMNFWTPFDILWYYLKRRYRPKNFWFVQRLYRTLFIVLITAFSCAFPSLSNLMATIGSLFVSNLAVSFPAVIQLSVEWTDYGPGRHSWRLYRFMLMMTFAGVVTVVGTIFSFKALLEELYIHKK